MRLGGPVFGSFATPAAWVQAHLALDYRAAFCPIDHTAASETIDEYRKAADEADLLIAEVGAWSNPLSNDKEQRRKARDFCKRQLELAEQIGSRCCVNISGSFGDQWDGHHKDNLTDYGFEAVVEMVQDIIDSVGPTVTAYTLEPMPWMYPDSPESYARLLDAVDRSQFGVHLDPVNMINQPARYYQNGAFLQECFTTLGGRIRSCHAKDIRMTQKLTVHLDEVRPGKGQLCYKTFLRELQKLDADTPLMLEHLSTAEEYRRAAEYVRTAAEALD